MSRWIPSSRWVTPQPPSAGPGGLRAEAAPQPGQPPKPDGALERIVKYVPAEIVSMYTVIVGLLAGFTGKTAAMPYVAVGVLAIFLLATVAVVVKNVPDAQVRRAHLIVTPLAFVAWAYPISSALLGAWFEPLVSVLLQAAVLALSVVIQPRS